MKGYMEPGKSDMIIKKPTSILAGALRVELNLSTEKSRAMIMTDEILASRPALLWAYKRRGKKRGVNWT